MRKDLAQSSAKAARKNTFLLDPRVAHGQVNVWLPNNVLHWAYDGWAFLSHLLPSFPICIIPIPPTSLDIDVTAI